jgi:FlaA1/EpsC-like NDP-sugar epimerase
MLMLSASRASFRLVGEFVERRRTIGQRCVIYGTGGAALSTIRAAFGTTTALRILGFVDDDPQQRHARVQGYPVVGDFQALVSMVDAGQLDCVVVNGPTVDAQRLKSLENACRAHRVSLLTLQIDLKPLLPASS